MALRVMETVWSRARGDTKGGKSQKRKLHSSFYCRSCLQDSGVHFVRGERQYLFDEQGQKYLDTVNNVPHGRRGWG